MKEQQQQQIVVAAEKPAPRKVVRQYFLSRLGTNTPSLTENSRQTSQLSPMHTSIFLCSISIHIYFFLLIFLVYSNLHEFFVCLTDIGLSAMQIYSLHCIINIYI